MNSCYFVPTTKELLAIILTNLYPHEHHYFKYVYGDYMTVLPNKILQHPSETLVVAPNEPICSFGVRAKADDTGFMWALMNASKVKQENMAFLKHSKRYIRRTHKQFPRLYALVSNDDAVHHKLLRWWGFTIEKNFKLVQGIPRACAYMGEYDE